MVDENLDKSVMHRANENSSSSSNSIEAIKVLEQGQTLKHTKSAGSAQ